LRADPYTREYTGFMRQANPSWAQDFFFAQLTEPAVGLSSSSDEAGLKSNEADVFKKVVGALNKLRPKYVTE
jgi:hypothetical protein